MGLGIHRKVGKSGEIGIVVNNEQNEEITINFILYT